MERRPYLEPGTTLDVYSIVRVVGAGGFGVTYEATDLNLGTTVAIKEYFPEDVATRTEDSRVRPSSDRNSQTFEWGRNSFLEEARTLARFHHPSIVQIFRIFEANSTAYMVMAFEQGLSLEAWLRGLDRPPLQTELDLLLRPLLEALEQMHVNNLLHRDIAPDNIIIRGDMTPVLLDFGAARQTVAARTHMLTGIFKHGYSPQEQYSTEGKFQGPWSDFYALGAVLYRAVTGAPPEEAPSRGIHDTLVPAAQAAKGIYRADFLNGIDACLRLKPADRPQTAQQARDVFFGASKSPSQVSVATVSEKAARKAERKKEASPARDSIRRNARDAAKVSGALLPAAFYRPEVRQVVYQAVLVLLIGFAAWWVINNVQDNLRRQNIASGFDFLWRRSGFDVSQTLIEYSSASTYARAFVVGLLNTLLAAVLGIVLATVIGFTIGIARLSHNWLIAKLATTYVEIVRNVPLLLQLFFWYYAVLKTLPGPRQSLQVWGGGFLNLRGLYLPAPLPQPGFEWVLGAACVGIAVSIAFVVFARRRQRETGQQLPVLLPSLALCLGLPLLAFLLSGRPLAFEYPQLRGFNFIDGMVIQPELMALVLGLSIYTASFVAETVRSGLLGVPKGQVEAASALGLSRGQSLRLVVVPQAMRIITPPLTSQYLNLTKNSSLAVAIGYPDFVSVFTGTVLNQTGQAIEVILITMAVFLIISLATSVGMNWFNRRMALVER